jgi:hypothetical protein
MWGTQNTLEVSMWPMGHELRTNALNVTVQVKMYLQQEHKNTFFVLIKCVPMKQG